KRASRRSPACSRDPEGRWGNLPARRRAARRMGHPGHDGIRIGGPLASPRPPAISSSVWISLGKVDPLVGPQCSHHLRSEQHDLSTPERTVAALPSRGWLLLGHPAAGTRVTRVTGICAPARDCPDDETDCPLRPPLTLAPAP